MVNAAGAAAEFKIQHSQFSPTVPANRFNAFTSYGVGIGLRIPHYDHILGKC